jgi:hypothetical protein
VAINAGPGRDWMDAGDGNDVFYTADNEADTILGGLGNNSAQIDKGLDVIDHIQHLI